MAIANAHMTRPAPLRPWCSRSRLDVASRLVGRARDQRSPYSEPPSTQHGRVNSPVGEPCPPHAASNIDGSQATRIGTSWPRTAPPVVDAARSDPAHAEHTRLGSEGGPHQNVRAGAHRPTARDVRTHRSNRAQSASTAHRPRSSSQRPGSGRAFLFVHCTHWQVMPSGQVSRQGSPGLLGAGKAGMEGAQPARASHSNAGAPTACRALLRSGWIPTSPSMNRVFIGGKCPRRLAVGASGRQGAVPVLSTKPTHSVRSKRERQLPGARRGGPVGHCPVSAPPRAPLRLEPTPRNQRECEGGDLNPYANYGASTSS